METTTILAKNFFWKTILKFNLRIITISFVIFLFNLSTIQAQNGDCKAKIKVENDRNSSGVPKEGTIYKLEITNDSFSTLSFNLKTENITTSCTNNDGSSPLSNVNLSALITDTDSNQISQITLNPGQTKYFMISIKALKETLIERWNCTKVIAKSLECSNYEVSTILHSYVSNPNEE